MKKTPVAILAASILLSACGGGAKPDPSSSTSSPTTSTSAPTVSVSPTTAGPTIDPNIPAAARAHTPAGAEAFVRYFYSQLNIAWSKPQAGLIAGLSAKTCKTCAALEGTAWDLTAKRQHYQGEALTIDTDGSISESAVRVVGEEGGGGGMGWECRARA